MQKSFAERLFLYLSVQVSVIAHLSRKFQVVFLNIQATLCQITKLLERIWK